MKKSVLCAVAMGLILCAGAARADMTYSPFLFDALDNSGNPIVDGTYAMVLDLDGNGWLGNSYLAQAPGGVLMPDSWLWDSNDLLMDVGAIVNGEAFPFRTIRTADIPASFTANADQYYLLWFDKPFNASLAGPGNGVFYGVESLGVVGTDPGDYGPFAIGGPALLQTQMIPEPISVILALLGGGAMALRRRFSVAAA